LEEPPPLDFLKQGNCKLRRRADRCDNFPGLAFQSVFRMIMIAHKHRLRNMRKENFDAGYSQERQKNDYDLLIVTDAISGCICFIAKYKSFPEPSMRCTYY
jgi:hypothetical protein